MNVPSENWPFEQFLLQLERKELVALVRRMTEFRGDLVPLLEAEAAARRTDAPFAELRRSVRSVFGSSRSSDFGVHVYDIIAPLESIFAKGKQLAADGAASRASSVFRALLAEILKHYESVHDEESELAGFAQRCTAELGRCLDQIRDPGERPVVLQALWEAYVWDINSGGFGVGDEVPDILCALYDRAEVRMIISWAEAAMPSGDPFSDSRTWRRRAFAGLLIALEGDDDDVRYLQRCREGALWDRLVDRLLRQGRIAETELVLSRINEHEIVSLLETFERHHALDAVLETAEMRARASEYPRALEWLRDWAARTGDTARAFGWAREIFEQNPGISSYRAVAEIATGRGEWEQLREAVHDSLRERCEFRLLTEVYLYEDDVPGAVGMLKRAEEVRMPGWHLAPNLDGLRTRVAEAAEKRDPAGAAKLYLPIITQSIAARGRDNYARAAALLKKVRKLCSESNEEEFWTRTIEEVYRNHRNLPALRDELRKAGLKVQA